MLFRHHQAVPAVPLTMPPATTPATEVTGVGAGAGDQARRAVGPDGRLILPDGPPPPPVATVPGLPPDRKPS